jgi:hypothetical protein
MKCLCCGNDVDCSAMGDVGKAECSIIPRCAGCINDAFVPWFCKTCKKPVMASKLNKVNSKKTCPDCNKSDGEYMNRCHRCSEVFYDDGKNIKYGNFTCTSKSKKHIV